jgi:hypothetical protein
MPTRHGLEYEHGNGLRAGMGGMIGLAHMPDGSDGMNRWYGLKVGVAC